MRVNSNNGGKKMKSYIKNRTLKLVSQIAAKQAAKSANTSCIVFAFQPELPKAVKKLRKF